MEEKTYASLAYMGSWFLDLAEYRFHDFMVYGESTCLVGVGILISGESGDAKQILKGFP